MRKCLKCTGQQHPFLDGLTRILPQGLAWHTRVPTCRSCTHWARGRPVLEIVTQARKGRSLLASGHLRRSMSFWSVCLQQAVSRSRAGCHAPGGTLFIYLFSAVQHATKLKHPETATHETTHSHPSLRACSPARITTPRCPRQSEHPMADYRQQLRQK